MLNSSNTSSIGFSDKTLSERGFDQQKTETKKDWLKLILILKHFHNIEGSWMKFM